MVEEAVTSIDQIKEEIEEDPHLPHSWDSGVVLDTVTALQMAEFQQVVDNIQRQVVSQNPPPAPPPYPYKVPASLTWLNLRAALISLYYPARKWQQRRITRV